MSTSDIDSILKEDRLFQPPEKFIAQASINNSDQVRQLLQKAEENNTEFWASQARQEISWHEAFTTALDDSAAPFFKWFPDGTMNVSFNCLDRHLTDKRDKTAIIFEGEQGDSRRISYGELHQEICRFANALKKLGIHSGDRKSVV